MAYGELDWENTHPAIRDMLVDLRYRGDYTGRTRRLVQEAAAANDLVAFASAFSDSSAWSGVPRDRQRRRLAFLEGALKQLEES